ncbi:MAG: hypothetical protein HYY96_15260 [Candidatus Tectomicrobia bacterium]|nr:hypothetical protein [Candidatus Tectomicrobia bacterium]
MDEPPLQATPQQPSASLPAAAGERVILDRQPHPILIVPSLSLVAIFLFTALASGESFIHLLAGIAALSALWHGRRRRRCRFLLTGTRFVVTLSRGWNQQDERAFPWSGLYKAECHQSVLGRLLGYGTLLLMTDRALPPLRLSFVPKVREYERAITEQLRAHAKRRVNELRERLAEVGSIVEIEAREFEKLMEVEPATPSPQ